MTKKEIERARYLFNQIGWWARQKGGEGGRAFELARKDHVFELAREGYYLLGKVQDPFPNEEKLKVPISFWIRPGIVIALWAILLALMVTDCAGWVKF